MRAGLNRLEELFIALALALMTVLTFTQIVLRAFGSGWVWSLEATTYLFAWLVLIGMSYGVRTGAHTGIDLLTRRLTPRWAAVNTWLAWLLCVTYSVSMLIASTIFVSRLMQMGHAARDLPIARWVLALALPLGFALLTWRFIEVAYRGGASADHGTQPR
jgi:C4-dicarboxylate transporter, DctQ subunit